jgi:WD40 repeat protein
MTDQSSLLHSHRMASGSHRFAQGCHNGEGGLLPCISPDGKRIASASLDCTVRMWDAATGEIVAGPFTGHRFCLLCCICTRCETHRLGLARLHASVRDSAKGEVVGPFTGHIDSVYSVAFAPDEKWGFRNRRGRSKSVFWTH